MATAVKQFIAVAALFDEFQVSYSAMAAQRCSPLRTKPPVSRAHSPPLTLLTAYRIISKTTPNDNAKTAVVYKMLGHVCCRQGKHKEAMKYNALALLLQINPQPLSIRGRH